MPANSLRFDVGGGAEVGVGVAPAVAIGPSVDVAVRRGPWSLGVEGRFLFGVATALQGVDVTSSVLEGALLGCFALKVPFVCATASIGRLAVSGTQSHDTLVGRVGPRLGADIPLSPGLALGLHVDLAVNLSRQDVTVGTPDPQWSSLRVAGLGGVALHGRFP